jgi:rhodanese-related sulfurtransferase
MAIRTLVLATACALPLAAAAQSSIPFVTTEELKRMIDAKEDFVLANALSPIEFAEERIAGSVNVPYDALRSGAVTLPQDRAKRLVFYCKGPKCTKSTKAAGLAVKMGYTNVAVYNEGLPEWLKRGYPAHTAKVYPLVDVAVLAPAELKRMLDAKEDVLVLDVRDEEDLGAGRIAGSKAIGIELLDRRLGEVPRTKKVVLVDLHGKQTQIVGRFLASKGYRDVARLDGGFVSGWLKAGLPAAR